VAENNHSGRYIVISILLFAVLFSFALAISVKSVVKKMNAEKEQGTSAGDQ
tara:strand:- start:212 stop:364 length:153 start_codon:yes stop_codon:yes gene_type:complete